MTIATCPSLIALAVLVAPTLAGDEPARLPIESIHGVDGEPIALKAPEGGALAVVFLWTECPISNQYSPALNAIAEEYGPDRLRLVGLFVDVEKEDGRVAAHAADYGLDFPVARLDSIELPRALGVVTVPTALVIDDEGRIRYRGRVDDRFYDRFPDRPGISVGKRQVVGTNDLEDAIAAVLTGEEVDPATTEAIGCTLPEYGEPAP